jgi:hypothetical protein
VPTTATLGSLAFFTGRVTSARVLSHCGSECEPEVTVVTAELESLDIDGNEVLLSSSIADSDPALLAAQVVDKLDRYSKTK